MKLTTGILLTAMAATAALAQNPTIIQNTKNTLNAAAKKAETEQNAALQAAGVPSKPAAGSTAKPSPAASNSRPQTVPVKPVAAPAKAPSASAKPVSAANPSATAPKAQTSAGTQVKPTQKPNAASGATAAGASKKSAPIKIAVAPVKPQPKQGAPKQAQTPKSAKTEKQETAKAASETPAKSEPAAESPKPTKTITAEGRRDPFLSPIVSRSTGPNCSTGKRCLAIDQIVVRGVVKADSGMIAVVVNSINKAYFLKENDPVYNGYVLRITGDSVVFKETFQDRLGKESTREVVKKITTPAV